ncbi:hypothetical protein CWB73_07795 [Pseudoalteromonas phenolica]|uniref:Uncharacterized protein n=1 Tax=Pseudoalteromonas phenolica TaxID=161398 RepID=A0A5S3YWC6_9GAMM|nr:hypothetical protein [Pseudoalteromonas phenolica]TMP81475.1 hypothetical protein CWB73_07795 [Pseudoalteromonas phenolica]
MLKRRRTHQFKRNTAQTSPNRRRVMTKNSHKKVLSRRKAFAIMQMDEIAYKEETAAQSS